MSKKENIKAEIYFTPGEVDELLLKDKNVIVIDVLRSTTTIITALDNGAKEIIPVASIEGAVKVSGSLFGDVTLRGGERNGKMIEGFNLGNSPAEYTSETIKGKTIIFCTSNGTNSILKGKYSKNLLIAGFVNISRITEYIHSLNEDFLILCSGKHNRYCLEDALCAGMILHKFQLVAKSKLQTNDAASSSMALYKNFSKSILQTVKNSEHGRFLFSLGFAEDLKTCTSIDTRPVIPFYTNGVLVLKKD